MCEYISLLGKEKDIDTWDSLFWYLKLYFNIEITSKVYPPLSLVLIIVSCIYFLLIYMLNPFATMKWNKRYRPVTMRKIKWYDLQVERYKNYVTKTLKRYSAKKFDKLICLWKWNNKLLYCSRPLMAFVCWNWI